MLDKNGNLVIKLVDGSLLHIRQPKGRDLEAIELANMSEDSPMKTNTGSILYLVSILNTDGLDLETLRDMSADNITVLSDAMAEMSFFRSIRQR